MLTGLDALVLTAVPLDFVYTFVLIAYQCAQRNNLQCLTQVQWPSVSFDGNSELTWTRYLFRAIGHHIP